VEEMGAILNVDVTKIDKSEYTEAARLIERNRLRQQVSLKQNLYAKKDLKSQEVLYKMICDTEELKRWGIKTDGNQTNNQTIEIKCADPDIIEKIKNL
jgi:hypothetical protein